MTSWENLQPRYRQFCLSRGSKTMKQIADEIPVNVRTAIRLMDGTTKQPNPATKEAIERLVWQMPASDEGGSGG